MNEDGESQGLGHMWAQGINAKHKRFERYRGKINSGSGMNEYIGKSLGKKKYIYSLA